MTTENQTTEKPNLEMLGEPIFGLIVRTEYKEEIDVEKNGHTLSMPVVSVQSAFSAGTWFSATAIERIAKMFYDLSPSRGGNGVDDLSDFIDYALYHIAVNIEYYNPKITLLFSDYETEYSIPKFIAYVHLDNVEIKNHEREIKMRALDIITTYDRRIITVKINVDGKTVRTLSPKYDVMEISEVYTLLFLMRLFAFVEKAFKTYLLVDGRKCVVHVNIFGKEIGFVPENSYEVDRELEELLNKK